MPRKKRDPETANDMRVLRDRLMKAEAVVADDSITPEDLLEDKKDEMEEKVALSKYRRGMIKRTLSRFKRCRNANDVFADFALDAAKGTVLEAQLAYTSGDRQRAQETILNRALGKPVDRVMSIGMQVSSKSEPELEHDIRRLLDELGFQGGEGATRALTPGREGAQRFSKAPDIQSESRVEWRAGVPRKVYHIDSEGEASDGG